VINDGLKGKKSQPGIENLVNQAFGETKRTIERRSQRAEARTLFKFSEEAGGKIGQWRRGGEEGTHELEYLKEEQSEETG